MNESDIKIKMLKENNDDLTSTRELKVKSRSLREAQEQVSRLRKEKSDWQELYLSGGPVKRAAEGSRTHS